jgi:hypothetical protein
MSQLKRDDLNIVAERAVLAGVALARQYVDENDPSEI